MSTDEATFNQGHQIARLALLAACAAVFLTALDQTVGVKALPQIITDLQISVVQLDRAAWIISGYLLGYVISMPLMGRISDMYGRSGVFLIWLSIFYPNLPIVAVLLFFIWRLIPASAHLKERIDLPGALLLGASLVCLSLGLAQEAGQLSPATTAPGGTPIQNNPWLIAAAIVLLVAFIALEISRERRRSWPVVELSIFKRAAFSATSLVSLLVGAALIIAMADIPIFIATVLGRPPLDSGLALLRLTAMIPVGALLGGWLCARITCRLTAILGLLLTAIGFWLMHLWPLDVNWTQISVGTLTGGFGFGLVIAPIGTTAINAVSQRQLGMASSVVTVLRMVGMILGLAALTSWGLGRFRTLAASFKAPANIKPFSAAYNMAYGHYLVVSAHEVYTAIFLAAGILCLLAVIPAFFLEGRKPSFLSSSKQNIRAEALGQETER